MEERTPVCGLVLALVPLIAAWGQSSPAIVYDSGFAGAAQGSGLLHATVSGRHHSGLAGLWDGEPRATQFVDGQLRIHLAPGDLARAGMHEIRVRDPVTGAESNPLPFHVWLPRRAEALAYDPARDRLYAADGATLVAIDLARRAVLGETNTGEPFRRMRVSSGGAYLYAMSPSRVWRRFDLLDEAPWLGPGIELFTGYEIAPMPGAPESFAAVTGGAREEARIAIYDGLVARPQAHLLDEQVYSALLAFDGPERIGASVSQLVFARFGTSVADSFRTVRVQGDGAAASARVPIRTNRYFGFAGGRVFGQSGIYDAAGQVQYRLSNTARMAADGEGRAAHLERFDVDGAGRLVVLDAASLDPLWSLAIPPAASGSPPPEFIGLNKGRFAYADPERGIVLLAQPPASSQPLAITGVPEPFSFEEAEDKVFRWNAVYPGGVAPLAGFFLTPAEACGYKPQSSLLYSANWTAPAEIALRLPLMEMPSGPPCLLGTYFLMQSGVRGPVARVPLEFRVTPRSRSAHRPRCSSSA